jgi:hypothetical protein
MKEILRRQSLRILLAKFLLLRCQMSLLVDESGIIITQMGTHTRSMVVMHGTPCAIPLCSSNIYIV